MMVLIEGFLPFMKCIADRSDRIHVQRREKFPVKYRVDARLR